MTIVRRDMMALTDAEWQRFVDALNAYKAATDPDTGESLYDQHTKRHFLAMMTPTLLPDETGTLRNAAHRGPVFFPWHRIALRELELGLQSYGIDPWYTDPLVPPATPLAIPYCRFLGMGSSWSTNAVWNRLGHNGVSTASPRWRVMDGPFAHWNSIIWNNTTQTFVPRAGILRKFNAKVAMPAPPNVTKTSNPVYDVSPWNELQATTTCFRRDAEQRHNGVHNLVGGDLIPGTSPNDPVFWLHHCNCDRYWAHWQRQQRISYGGTHIDHYQPVGAEDPATLAGGPAGHRLYDVLAMFPNQPRIADALDFRAMGFTYDTIG